MRGRAAAAALAVVMIAGCGGGSDHKSKRPEPPPKTVGAWIAEWARATKAGDCKRLKVIAPNFPCGIRASFRGARAVANASYGPGAVVDYVGVRYAKPPQWPGHTQMVLVNVRGGGWIASYDVSYSEREVGTKEPHSVKPFETAANTFNEAVAEGNCRVAYDFTVAGQPKEAYCRTVVESKALDHQVIAGNPPLRLEPIGGTANIQFFRSLLRVPKRVDPKGGTVYVTVPVVRTSRMAQAHGASNPYLVGAAYPAPTPADVAAEGPYTKAVRDRYVENSGGNSAQARCEIEMIAAAVPYPDFSTPGERFDRALAGIKTACRVSNQGSGTAEQKNVAHVVLGGDLVPGYICSPDVSTDKVIVAVGGSRFACGRDLGSAPPDRTVEITDVSVAGDTATAKGTDKHGHFTVSLVRQGTRWLIDDFPNSG